MDGTQVIIAIAAAFVAGFGCAEGWAYARWIYRRQRWRRQWRRLAKDAPLTIRLFQLHRYNQGELTP